MLSQHYRIILLRNGVIYHMLAAERAMLTECLLIR